MLSKRQDTLNSFFNVTLTPIIAIIAQREANNERPYLLSNALKIQQFLEQAPSSLKNKETLKRFKLRELDFNHLISF